MLSRGVCVNCIHMENLCVAWTVDVCKIRSNLKPSGPAKRRLVDGWCTGRARDIEGSSLCRRLLFLSCVR